MFGTFVAEREDDPPKYGLINNISTYNPIRIAFHEWAAMFRDWAGHAACGKSPVTCSDHPAGEPDGTGPTAANVRAAWISDGAGS